MPHQSKSKVTITLCFQFYSASYGLKRVKYILWLAEFMVKTHKLSHKYYLNKQSTTVGSPLSKQFNYKCVQMSEFVWISESHSFI